MVKLADLLARLEAMSGTYTGRKRRTHLWNVVEDQGSSETVLGRIGVRPMDETAVEEERIPRPHLGLHGLDTRWQPHLMSVKAIRNVRLLIVTHDL